MLQGLGLGSSASWGKWWESCAQSSLFILILNNLYIYFCLISVISNHLYLIKSFVLLATIINIHKKAVYCLFIAFIYILDVFETRKQDFLK